MYNKELSFATWQRAAFFVAIIIRYREKLGLKKGNSDRRNVLLIHKNTKSCQ